MPDIQPLVAPGAPLDARELARYSRHLTLPGVGMVGQRRIRNAKVLVIGAGGLGAPIINYLVAAGVGQLSVIDQDVVEPSNLQRQVIHRQCDIGVPKAESAHLAALRLDEHAQVTAIVERLTPQNALELFSAHDLVLDGTDNFATRYLCNDAAEITGTPLVWGTIFRFTGQVSVFAPGHGPMLRDLFPDLPEADSVPSCAEGGVFGTLCGVVGSTMATEALKLICGIGEPLIGKFWSYDALNASTNILNFEVDPQRPPVSSLGNYDPVCAVGQTVAEIDSSGLEEMRTAGSTLVIDVREAWERELACIPGSVHIPLDRLIEEGWNAMGPAGGTGQVVLVCKSGARSLRAARHLAGSKTQNRLFSLSGGTLGWVQEVEGREVVY